MRSLTREFYRRLSSDDFEPVELLDIQLFGASAGSTIYLTSNPTPVVWRNNTYVPFTFARGQVDERLSTTSGESPAVTITITNVDSQMANLLANHQLEGAIATLSVTDRKILARNHAWFDGMIITKGEVRDAVLADETLVFQIVSIIGQKERITIPLRVFQSHCNYVFGSKSCTVNTSAVPYSITSTVVSGTTKHIDVPMSVYTTAGSPADPSDFWSSGYIMMGNGVIALNSRPIQRIELLTNMRIWMRYPLPAAPGVGDQIVVKRGCQHTKSACQDRQGNVFNYGGFEEVPPLQFDPNVKRDAPGIS